MYVGHKLMGKKSNVWWMPQKKRVNNLNIIYYVLKLTRKICPKTMLNFQFHEKILLILFADHQVKYISLCMLFLGLKFHAH